MKLVKKIQKLHLIKVKSISFGTKNKNYNLGLWRKTSNDLSEMKIPEEIPIEKSDDVVQVSFSDPKM